ncbi:MFS transporter, partial [Isoptericola sp. QY 916]|uniref:MFS transporter n=1 Tax=Isoptericola sp. QY 916 TaxID=2782570 RepID=UPI003D2FE8A5|nr:MFS transporter [Isoptericola sp. QY 916]
PGSWAAAAMPGLAPVTRAAVAYYPAPLLVALGVRADVDTYRVADVLTPDPADPEPEHGPDDPAGWLSGWEDYLRFLADRVGPGVDVGDVEAVADLDAVGDPDDDPGDDPDGTDEGDPWGPVLAALVADPDARRALVALCVLNAAAWAIFTQLQLVVPLRLDAVLGSSVGVGAVYAAAAVLVLALTVPATRWLQARLRLPVVLALGVATMGAGIAVLGGGPGVVSLVAGMVVFTLGQMVFQPAMSAVVAEGAPAASVATRFGVNGLALAVGGVVGSSVVGALLAGPLAHGGWAWAGFALAGAAVAVGYGRVRVG